MNMLKKGPRLCPCCGGQWIDYMNSTGRLCPECGGSKEVALTCYEWIDKAIFYHADFPLTSIEEFQVGEGV